MTICCFRWSLCKSRIHDKCQKPATLRARPYCGKVVLGQPKCPPRSIAWARAKLIAVNRPLGNCAFDQAFGMSYSIICTTALPVQATCMQGSTPRLPDADGGPHTCAWTSIPIQSSC